MPAPETGGWTTYNFPFVAKDTTAGLRVYFQALPTEIGRIDIARVHVYSAQPPELCADVSLLFERED